MSEDGKITSAEVVAGERSTVQFTWPPGCDGQGPKTYTLELRSVERRKQRLKALDFQKNHAKLVASARLAPGVASASLDVPAGTAPGYDGTILAWQHELRLLGRGSELVDSFRCGVTPGTKAPTESPEVSGALTLSNLAKDPGVEVRSSVMVGIPLLGLSIALFAFGLLASSADDRAPLYFGGGFGVVTLVMAVSLLSTVFSRGRSLGAVEIHIADEVVQRGHDVVVDLSNATVGDVEIGLLAAELVTDISEQRNAARKHELHEEYVVHNGHPVQLRVPADAPVGYVGGVSLHWIVRVRSTRTKTGAGGRPITVWGPA